MSKLVDRLFLLNGKWHEPPIDLTTLAADLPVDGDNPAIDPYWCNQLREKLLKEMGADYAWGGYLEDRNILWRGHYHQPGCGYHLGVDYWVPSNTHVYLPCNGVLRCAEVSGDQDGGWGGKLTFQMDNGLYIVFGHLTLPILRLGAKFLAGDYIGYVATIENNGGWSPHLHVQCCAKYDPNVDGYGPMTDSIREDFPDPELVLGE